MGADVIHGTECCVTLIMLIARWYWNWQLLNGKMILSIKPKWRTSLKLLLILKNYAMSIINRQKRALTVQLGMGILPTKIETGRFRNMSREELFMSYVEWMKLKTFLRKCPVYDDLKQLLYRKAQSVSFDFNTYGSEEKLISLMKYVWSKVSIYSLNDLNRRKNILYIRVGRQSQRLPYHMRLIYGLNL